MPRAVHAIAVILMLTLLVETAALAQRKTPYWASISASQARMRTGPGRQFPASWLYQRAGLPVVVVQSYPNWRKIRDPDGETGWIQANLLSDDRTALIRGDVRPLREKPNMAAAVIWRAEPGVVGKITECARGWCKFDARGRMGYVEAAHIWGADAPEPRP